MAIYIGASNIISPLGNTTSDNIKALLNEERAVKKHRFSFSESLWCCSKIGNESLTESFSSINQASENYTYLEKMCILSIADVVDKSGVDLGRSDTLLIVSTAKGNIDVLEGAYSNMDPSRAYLSTFANTIGAHFNCKNRPVVVSNACISGVLSMIMAKRYIDSNLYKNIIVCGADMISEFTLTGFKACGALSDDPSKPFDKNRVGINLGEAAVSVLLSAEKVGSIKIIGGSSTNDANHITGPSRTADGLYKGIKETLKEAKLNAVDLISAHGTATLYNDEMESIAFSRANILPSMVNSLKGYYGHTLGAAGVLESVVSIESMLNNTAIKSAGFESTGTSHELNVIKKTVTTSINTCLKTASGFGGCNAVALFEKE